MFANDGVGQNDRVRAQRLTQLRSQAGLELCKLRLQVSHGLGLSVAVRIERSFGQQVQRKCYEKCVVDFQSKDISAMEKSNPSR